MNWKDFLKPTRGKIIIFIIIFIFFFPIAGYTTSFMCAGSDPCPDQSGLCFGLLGGTPLYFLSFCVPILAVPFVFIIEYLVACLIVTLYHRIKNPQRPQSPSPQA